MQSKKENENAREREREEKTEELRKYDSEKNEEEAAPTPPAIATA